MFPRPWVYDRRHTNEEINILLVASSFVKTVSAFRRLFLRILLPCAILTASNSSVSAFDTFWHHSMASEVGAKWGFSPDAIRVLQLSSSCVDYFGPFITEAVGFFVKNVSYLELSNLPTTGETHAASNFLHFDNLAGQLDRNWKFDYLSSRLLNNTMTLIARYYNDTVHKRDVRKKHTS